MNFDWFGYLTLAEHMMNNHDSYPDEEPFREAVYRSIVSRAYYSVYCMARNYVRDVDRREFSGSAHQELQNYLIRHPEKIRKKLGSQLKNLHEHRLKVDYEDDLHELAINKAKRAIAEAKIIVQGLATLPPKKSR